MSEVPEKYKHRILLDEHELPLVFGKDGFSRQQMRNHRNAGTGPRCVRVGRFWKYPLAEVISWVEAQST